MSTELLFKRLIEGPSPEVLGRVARKRQLRIKDAVDTARRTGDVDDIARALNSEVKLRSFVNTSDRWIARKGKDESWVRAARKAANTPDFWEKHGTKVKVGGAALGVAGGLYAAHRLRKWYKGKSNTQKPAPRQMNQPDKKQRMQDPTQPASYPFESTRGDTKMNTLMERLQFLPALVTYGTNAAIGYYRGRKDAKQGRKHSYLKSMARWTGAGALGGGAVGAGMGARMGGREDAKFLGLLGAAGGAGGGLAFGASHNIGRALGRHMNRAKESEDLSKNKNAQDIWKEIKRNQLLRRMEELVKKHKRKGGSAAAGRLAQLGRTTGGKLLQSNTDACYAALMEVMRKDNPKLLRDLSDYAMLKGFLSNDKGYSDRKIRQSTRFEHRLIDYKHGGIHNKIKNAKKTKPLKAAPAMGLGKKIGIGLGVGALGYGAYKYYQHRKNKKQQAEESDNANAFNLQEVSVALALRAAGKAGRDVLDPKRGQQYSRFTKYALKKVRAPKPHPSSPFSFKGAELFGGGGRIF